MSQDLQWNGSEGDTQIAKAEFGEYRIDPIDGAFMVTFPDGPDKNGRYSFDFAKFWAQFDYDERRKNDESD